MTETQNIKNIWIVKDAESLSSILGENAPSRAISLARYCSRQNINVTYWSNKFDHKNKKRLHDYDRIKKKALEHLNIKLNNYGYIPYSKNLSVRRQISHFLGACSFFIKGLKQTKPDLIFVCYPTVELCFAATILGKVRNIPVHVDVRDLWPDVIIELSPSKLYQISVKLLILPFLLMRWFIFKNACSVSVISEGFQTWARDAGYRGHIHIRPITFEKIISHNRGLQNGKSQSLGALTMDRLNIAYVGTISYVPKFDVLLEALDILRDMNIEVFNSIQIIVAGEGEQRQYLQQKSREKDLPIKCLGFINSEELNELYSHSETALILYPDRSDFLTSKPGKFAEYLQNSLPIITITAGDQKVFLAEHDCGIYCESAEALAKAFMRIRQRPNELKVLKLNALKCYNDIFDHEKGMKEFLNFLSESYGNKNSSDHRNNIKR